MFRLNFSFFFASSLLVLSSFMLFSLSLPSSSYLLLSVLYPSFTLYISFFSTSFPSPLQTWLLFIYFHTWRCSMLSYALYFFSCFYILVSFFSLYFLSFLGFFLLSMSFIIHFSLSFHILLFYNFLTSISHVDYYIQFHFLTCSSMTSSSFSNSFNSPFFIFFIPFWY